MSAARPRARALRSASRCSLLALAALAAPSRWRSEAIDSFTTTTSDTQAGGHPDLSTSFTLAQPRRNPRPRRT